MRTLRKIATVFALVLALALPVFSGPYYADNVGPDTNAGTIDAPVKTLSKLVSLVTSTRPGYLKAGVIWNERLNINKSGTAGNPLIFGRYGDAWLANPIIDGTGLANAVVYTANDYITLQDITVTGADVGRRNIYIDSGADTITLTRMHSLNGDQPLITDGVTNLVIQDSVFEGAEDLVAASSFWFRNTTGTVNRTIFRPSASNAIRRIVLYGTASNMTFNNVDVTGFVSDAFQVASGSTLTVTNSYIGGNRDGGGYVINNSGTSSISNSLTQRAWGTTAEFNGTVTQSNNLDASTVIPIPRFVSPGREGIISITVDDYDLDYAIDVARTAERYGYRISLYVYQTGVATVTDYAAKLRALVFGGAYGLQGGHEVGSHSYSHPTLTSLASFTISCSDATATMSLVTNTTGTSGVWTGTLTTSTAAGGAPNLNIDLTSSSYNTISKLCTYIAGQTGYTCTRASTMSPDAKSTILANVTNQSITGTGYAAQAQQGAFFNVEIAESKTWIEGVIGGGYSVRTFAYPGGLSNAAAISAVAAAGYIAGRGGSSTLLGSFPIFTMYHNQISDNDGDGSQSAERKLAAAWAESMVHHGMYGAMLSHSASETTLDQWGWIFETLNASSVRVMRVVDAAARIRESGLWATADSGVTWTRTWTNPADYHLTANSPMVDAGATSGTDIGPYEFSGSFIYGSGRLNTNVYGKDGVGDTNVYRP